MGINALLSCTLLALLLGFIDRQALPFLFLHTFNFGLLTLVQIGIVVLLSLHEAELLFFENLHPSLLESFSADHTKKRFNLIVKDEKFVIFDECFLGNAAQFWHSVSSRRSLNFEGSLTSNFVYRCLISELRNELVSLNINILFAGRGLRSLDITREKLFSCLCPLLLHGLWVVLGLVGMKQFIGVSSSWDDHSSVGAATINTLIVHDVVGGIVF